MLMRRAALRCGPPPWPAQARKHPAVAGRVPQAAPESQVLLVILSKVTDVSLRST